MLNTSQINVLLVDDKPANLLSLESLLEDLDDLIIHKANSGNEALGKLLETDFALVLLDVQMPGMDGFEVAKLMRGSERTRQIPIIFITAINKEQKHISLGYDSGAVDYLFKPIDPDILKSKVKIFIDLFKQKLTLEEITRKLEKTISELIESKESLKTAKIEAEKASRIKSDFLTNMSHEIRTPLNGIIGMAELALLGELEDIQRERVQTIRQSGESLLDILNEILDISKIEADKMELESIEFNLQDVNAKVIRLLAVKAFQKGIELLDYVDPRLNEYYVGDPVRIRQVLTNLLGNAVKFTDTGKVRFNILLERVMAESTLISFCIEDTGIGIPENKLDRLFETFSQVDTSITRKYGGTGLGLPISKRLVEMMDGKIQVESKEGEGSRFSFMLEFKNVQKPGNELKKQEFEGTNILIFDHSNEGIEILNEYFDYLGVNATIAESTEMLIDKITSGTLYDYLFIGPVNGCQNPFKTVELINERFNSGDLPYLVFMSADNSILIRDHIKEYRINDFLLKPVLIGDLVKILKKPKEKSMSHENEKEKTVGSGVKGKKLDVLLVEDNLINQKLANGFMKLNGWNVTVANNGLEAVEHYQQTKFDIIFMDVQMPEMDGFEATLAIRSIERESKEHIPIVAMTAHAMKGYKEVCLEKGMDDYMTKPINSEKIIEAAERNLNRKTN